MPSVYTLIYDNECPSSVPELDDRELQLLDLLLLLQVHTQVAETIEQLLRILLALQAQEIREEWDSICGWV